MKISFVKHIIELEIGSPVKLKDRANQKTGEEMKETIEKQSNTVQYNVLDGKECGGVCESSQESLPPGSRLEQPAPLTIIHMSRFKLTRVFFRFTNTQLKKSV